MIKIKNRKEYLKYYKLSVEHPEKFWAQVAKSFKWRKKWTKVLEWNFINPNIKWFINGKLNITENCLDRHLKNNPQSVAIIWEPNDPKEKNIKLTYKELHLKVCQFANVLKNNNVKKGDRVCIYMGMTPEAVIAMLACARVGAVHSVVFGGFSANALSDRIKDAKAKLVITSDGAYRGQKVIELKKIVDEAIDLLEKTKTNTVKKVIISKRTGIEINLVKKRDLWWEDEILKVSSKNSAEVMDAEDLLFILYTSGSTGKPKGIMHTCGGYMVYAAYTFLNVFQYSPKKVFWCTADVGWITGHSYIVYGPLLNGATTLMFEGIPTWPDAGRYWEIVDKYKVSTFYTSPTAIRTMQTFDLKFVNKYSLKSLKVLGTVGEPINEEAWHWYNENIGKNKCDIVDTWWQTETGGFMLSPIAGVTKTIPGYATLPLPGVQPVLLDDDGKENKDQGNLCFKFPWPGILRGIYGDKKRYKQVYFSQFKNYYFSSDRALCDEKGNYRVTGRTDDCLNVSGHLLGTAEIENAINKHPNIVESAVVGFEHPIKGLGVYAFLISSKKEINQELHKEVNTVVAKYLGPIAKPDKIQVVSGLPKTRSGKIMRRILRKIASGEKDFGDVSTLLNPDIVEEIWSKRV